MFPLSPPPIIMWLIRGETCDLFAYEGMRSKQTFELTFLSKAANNEWALDLDNRVVLPGSHGSEIVRSFCFFDDEQVVFTTGEDGNVKAWRAG